MLKSASVFETGTSVIKEEKQAETRWGRWQMDFPSSCRSRQVGGDGWENPIVTHLEQKLSFSQFFWLVGWLFCFGSKELSYVTVGCSPEEHPTLALDTRGLDSNSNSNTY